MIVEITESALTSELCKNSMSIEISPGHMGSGTYNMTISKDNDEDEDDEYSDLKCHVCIIDSKTKKYVQILFL